MTDSGEPRETDPMTDFAKLRETIERGGPARYHEAAAARGKLFARDRIAFLIDEGGFTEGGRFANALADGLPADGVVTGTATIGARPVALMANDSTVKAGSWGARTVEKIIRIIEKAYNAGLPMIYLVDSAGARITDQVDMFPGRGGCLYPGVLRLHRDGGRHRLDVPGQPADGRDGGEREDHAGGDGRRPAALHGVRQRALPGLVGGRGAGRGARLSVLPAAELVLAL